MINSILSFLESNFNSDGYYVKEFSGNLYFGKDQNNNYICTRKTNSKTRPFSIKTDCIHLYQNYNFELTIGNETSIGSYDMILLKNEFSKNLKTFVNLCLNFYSCDNEREIIELTEDLIELLKSTKNKNENLEQGLWAELFTIKYLYEIFSINILEFWHKDIYMKYDFSIEKDKKIEVKSTTRENRTHKFSHSQVYTMNKVIIASVLMRKDDSGLTVFELFEKVQEMFKGKYQIFSAIHKELHKLDQGNLEKYDYEYSRDNIQFYLNHSVPHFKLDEPDGVFHTQYDIDLENVDCIPETELAKCLLE